MLARRAPSFAAAPEYEWPQRRIQRDEKQMRKRESGEDPRFRVQRCFPLTDAITSFPSIVALPVAAVRLPSANFRSFKINLTHRLPVTANENAAIGPCKATPRHKAGCRRMVGTMRGCLPDVIV